MKTEKQVRTWWLVAHHSDPETPIHIFDLPIDEGIKVIAHEDHLAIVAELEERIQKLRKALKRASENIGDLCIFPEKRKWEHEKQEIEFARQALKEDEK